MRLFRAHLLNPTSPTSFDSFTDGGLAVGGDGRILRVGGFEEVQAFSPAADVTDFRPNLLIPGLVDLHCHLPQYEFVGLEGLELLDWLDRYIFPAEERFADPAIAEEASRSFFTDLVAAGTTTAAVYLTVHQQSADLAFREAERRGLHVVMGKVMTDQNCPGSLQEEPQTSLRQSEELCQQWHGRNNGRLRYAFTPRFAPTCSHGLMVSAAELADKYDAYIQTHLAENLEEVKLVESLFPEAQSYTHLYRDCGLLGPRTLLAHCVYLTPEEFKLIAATDSAVAHCASSNFFLRSGVLDLAKFTERGVRLGLGSDVGGGPNLSLLREMGAACYASKARYAMERFVTARLKDLRERTPTCDRPLLDQVESALEIGDEVQVLSPVLAFYLATLGGAEALGLADAVGSLSPDKDADFVVVETAVLDPTHGRNPSRRPEELLSHLAYRGSEAAVLATYVKGEPAFTRSRG